MRELPAVVVLAALSLAGCATLPKEERWMAASSVYTRLTTLDLREIPMNGDRHEALDASLHALTFAVALGGGS